MLTNPNLQKRVSLQAKRSPIRNSGAYHPTPNGATRNGHTPGTSRNVTRNGQTRYSEINEVSIEEWRKYKKSDSLELRNSLIVHYDELAINGAEEVARVLQSYLQFDDLVSYARTGLMDAVEKFDLERGVMFKTYASERIRGAIFDGLIEEDWRPWLVRERNKKFKKAHQKVKMREGRPPTDEEIREELGVDDSEYSRIKNDGANPTKMLSLSPTTSEDDNKEDITYAELIEDKRQPTPLTVVQKREKGDEREFLTTGLSKRERLILILHYYEGMTMKQIGEQVLGLGESGVSRVHKKLLEILRVRSNLEDRLLQPA